VRLGPAVAALLHVLLELDPPDQIKRLPSMQEAEDDDEGEEALDTKEVFDQIKPDKGDT
jgi:hypothetical protein